MDENFIREVWLNFTSVEKTHGEEWVRAIFEEYFNSYKGDVYKFNDLILAIQDKIRSKNVFQELYEELRDRCANYLGL